MLKNDSEKMGETIFPTLNQYGYTHSEPLKFGKLFINYCKGTEKPVLDIGATYGVTTIPSLKNGATVIANDIEPRHLRLLKINTPKSLRANLQTCLGKIPDEVNFGECSLAAVLASGVLHFLTYDKFLLSLKKIYKWLDHGGSFFFETSSIFNKHFNEFYDSYLENKKRGDECPGFITNTGKYIKEMSGFVPEHLILFSLEEVITIFEAENFKILRAEYFDNDFLDQNSKELKTDSVGVVAQKR